MSQRILAISGRKQSGKSSAARFVAGTELVKKGVIKYRDMDDDGNLRVNGVTTGEDGKPQELMYQFDIDQDVYSQEPEFTEYMYNMIYPHVRIYSFADPLKEFLVDILGLKPEQVYGSDAQKSSNTSYTWKDFAFIFSNQAQGEMKKEGTLDKRMTAREVMEVFGTKICRKIYGECWLNATVNRIQSENVPLAIVADVRFPNEMKKLRKMGAVALRLEKDDFQSTAEPEVAMDKYKQFDIKIYNQHMTMVEKNQKLMDELHAKGFFPVEIGG